MVRIGKIIRTFRTQRGLTLKELAERADISAPYLSQIENDQVNMNMSVLEGISAALGTPIYMLFIQENVDNISYVAKDERYQTSRNDGVLMEVLVDRQIIQDDIHIMHFPKNYKADKYAAHPGEEFFFVLEGAMAIDFSGYKMVELLEGDSLAFSSKVPHSITSQKGCRALVHSSTPPLAFL